MRQYFKLALLVCLSLAILLVANSAMARKGIYVGLGSSGLSIKDGPDGKTYLVDDVTNPTLVYNQYAMESSSGLGYFLGWGIHRFISVEYQASSNTGKAAFTSSGIKTEKDATMDIAMGDVRLNLPLGQRFEVYVLGGMTQGVATIKDAAAKGSSSGGIGGFTASQTTASQYKGTGQTTGFGMEFFMNRMGIGLSQNVHSLSYNSLTGVGTSSEIKPAIKTEITQTLLTISYNFMGTK